MFGLGVNRLGASRSVLGDAIANLFSNGEQGVWYDPSDLTTMFQNDTSAVPAVIGQSVGTMLDKSQGLKLGSELITNGDFATDSNWNTGTGWSIAGGVAVADNVTGANLTQGNLGLTANIVYEVTFTVKTRSSGTVLVRLGGSTPVSSESYNSAGTYTARLRGNSTNTTFAIRGQNGFTGTIDNVSLKVIQGNHAYVDTSVNRPTLRESGGLRYLEFDGVSDGMFIKGLTSTSTPLTAWFGYSATNAEAANKKFLLDIQATRAVLAASANTAGNIGYFDGEWSEFAADSNALKVLTYDLVENNAKIRVDGTQEYSDTTYDQLAIGGQIALFAKFNVLDNYLAGNLYSCILRAAESTDKEIASTESYVAKKIGLLAQVDGIATLSLDFAGNTYTARDSNGGIL
jgi:hypothetical protein